MRGYRIQQQGNRWQYLLIPNNNNNQPVARSMMYDSEKKCEEGLRAFRKMVVENCVNSIDSPYIVLEEQDKRLFVCYVIEGRTVLKAGSYENKQNCRGGVKAIFTHIDKYTLHRVWD